MKHEHRNFGPTYVVFCDVCETTHQQTDKWPKVSLYKVHAVWVQCVLKNIFQ